MSARLWCVNRRPSAVAEVPDVLFTATVAELVNAARGGMNMENVETFAGERAEQDAREYARQEMNRLRDHFAALAADVMVSK